MGILPLSNFSRGHIYDGQIIRMVSDILLVDIGQKRDAVVPVEGLNRLPGRGGCPVSTLS